MKSAPGVVLLGRDGCHLCDEVRSRLIEISHGGARFTLREVDIESDPELLAKHLERIPVVELDGQEVCALGLDEDRLMASLGSL